MLSQRQYFFLIICFLLSLASGLGLISIIVPLAFLLFLLPSILKKDVSRAVYFLICLGVIILSFMRGFGVEKEYQDSLGYVGSFNGALEVKEKGSYNNYTGKLLSPPYQLVTFKSEESLAIGWELSVKGSLEVPKDVFNQDGFSELGYLKSKGVFLRLEVDKQVFIKEKMTMESFLSEYKEGYLEKLSAYLGENTGYLQSVFLGDSSKLLDEEKEDWRKLGLLHLLAVSGSHVGVLIELGFLFTLLLPGKRSIKMIILLTMLLLYGLIIGSPSVFRCLIFLLLKLIWERLDRPKNNLMLLGITSIILLLINPLYLLQLSFQLSFIVMIGFYAFEFLWEGKTQIRKIIGLGVVSFLSSLPLLAYYFQEASYLSIVTTPLIVPILSLIIILAGMFFYLPFLIGILSPLGIVLNRLIELQNLLIAKMGDLPIRMLSFRKPGIFVLVVYYGTIFFLRDSLKKKKKIWLGILLLGGAALWLMFPLGNNKDLEVHFINVGQGDCILIRMPEGQGDILIDSGKKDEYIDMGTREVVPYLRRLGIRSLDVFISTHSDNDHLGGAPSIFKELDIRSILIPKLKEKDPLYKWLEEEYASKIQEVKKGAEISVGEAKITVLNPLNKSNGDSNDDSIVLKLEYMGRKLLFTGDLGLVGMDRLEVQGERYEVIKAPHHGSDNSFRENLYKELNPQLVIFSVGKNNYGHPGSLLLQELEREEIEYLRTDEEGTIILEVGKEIVVK